MCTETKSFSPCKYVQVFKKCCVSLPWRFNVNLQSKLSLTLKQSFSFINGGSWSLNVSGYSMVMSNGSDR